MRKVVISIPDEEYKYLKQHCRPNNERQFVSDMMHRIANGVVLPKGHGDLVDISQRVTVQLFDHEFEEFTAKTMTIEDCLLRSIDEDIEPVIKADEEEAS